MSEMEEQVNQTSQNNLPTAKQEFIDETESAINIPESLKTDTGHPLQYRQYQTAHHIKALTWMQTCNMINYKTKMNKILLYTMQMYFMMTMIVQLLTLLLMAPQFSWKSQSLNFSLLMMLPYQMKR